MILTQHNFGKTIFVKRRTG